MIDTHIWIWWVNNSKEISSQQLKIIQDNQREGIGVSIISCWEIAKLVELEKLVLSFPVEEWIRKALSYPGVVLLDLTLESVLESTKLPGTFHKDPADQIIVATARILDCPLLTADAKILKYDYVKIATK